MTAMTATFELERFAWDDGSFEVSGRWTADTERSLGKVRLVVEIDGRRRRIGAQGGKQAAPGMWTARFQCQRRPRYAGPAELEVGGDLIIDLPKPELPPREEAPPQPPPQPAAPAPDVRGAEALLEQLRSERAEAEAATRRLQTEREAAEDAVRRLADERAAAEQAARTPAPRREAIRESLARPREPKGVLPSDEPGRQREIAYALAGVIVILIVVLLLLLL